MKVYSELDIMKIFHGSICHIRINSHFIKCSLVYTDHVRIK